MTAPAERMKDIRARRCAQGLRDVRLLVPDSRSQTVCQRIARQVAALNRDDENATLSWIEAVSEFDMPGAR